MSDKLSTIREYKTRRFVVEIAEHVEYTPPEDAISWADGPNDMEGKQAEAEYCEKIRNGTYPWYCLGVHVKTRNDHAPYRELGSAYLGCVDTKDWRDVGGRDIATEAIREARELIARAAL